MKKNDSFIIPEEERKDFDLLVQRANRRIISNMKYIQKEEIKDPATQRALIGKFTDPLEWQGRKTAFSRSVRFSSEKEYKQYLRTVDKFGSLEEPRTVEGLREGYAKAIIKSLTTVAIDNPGVLTAKGRLPANIAKKVREMSLEQMKHYFEEGDPADDIEYLPYSGEDYYGVDRQQFVDITMKRLNTLKEIYPSKKQRLLRETYGKKHPNKQIFELEKMFDRDVKKKAKKGKKNKHKRKK